MRFMGKERERERAFAYKPCNIKERSQNVWAPKELVFLKLNY